MFREIVRATTAAALAATAVLFLSNVATAQARTAEAGQYAQFAAPAPEDEDGLDFGGILEGIIGGIGDIGG
ncbi:hypothetical protein BGM19_33350 [Streptomyces agglomeratus]|uniref:hypothetical protein n=1 Tax=Streptomyces agglomeratus TaxID=285458 RepID=UPI00086EA1F0|nr:hypothetical protein [Streptomyces agglomeratus]OEJ62189.1 hypothetical protein BGM19_33350 [Streptomyces agglomeratus]